ncbi:MAG: hypothetical protein AB7F19_03430 [Candidatus Babeliales bacterium]
MKKHAIFKKVKDHMYLFNGASDSSVFTLYMFLGDGLYRSTYFEFLENAQEKEFYGNITTMQKQGSMVTVALTADIIPNMLPFTTTSENLIQILKEWDRLRLLQVNEIKFSLENDVLEIVGN